MSVDRSVLNELVSATIRLRLANEEDAAFIHTLRVDPGISRYLSKVDPDVRKQAAWLRAYKEREEVRQEFYFIIEALPATPVGTVRLYDFKACSFSWGSWILNEKKPKYASIESALLVYKFGFGFLGFAKSHFEVMKANERVVLFHRRMGAIELAEDETNIYFEFTKVQYELAKQEFAPFTSK